MNTLQQITKIQALDILEEAFDCKMHNLMYYSFPQVFSTTAGPFLRQGDFAGQAFTEYQIEIWTDGHYALVFSRGREIKCIECTSPFTVEWYLGQRGNWY